MQLARLRPYVIGAVVAALGLVAANGVAAATTGHAFVLGASNRANAVTTLSRTTTGPALALKARSGSPALSVSNGRLVKHLNADAVDGLSARALSARVFQYSFPVNLASTSEDLALTGLPPGRYLASYSVTMRPFTNPITVACGFHSVSGDSYSISAVAAQPAGLTVASVSGSGVLDTRSSAYTFRCTSTGNSFIWVQDDPNYSTVTLLRLDHVVSK